MGDWDKAEGKLKEGEGKLTGDETRENQGKAEQTWEDTKDTASDTWDDAKDKVS